jgi:hypothetical protein
MLRCQKVNALVSAQDLLESGTFPLTVRLGEQTESTADGKLKARQGQTVSSGNSFSASAFPSNLR